ncbi:MAG: aminotransferase class V-fold PLP-dependent enzyme [Deltaproteobacteria bacterium]|nr:aminotransferase class V-fold PLP-dependent enzyme [Deltaproteobacteria bacterium]
MFDPRAFLYLDNAATSLPKPRGVADAVRNAILRAGNPGRSAHALSIRSARDLFEARERVARFFGATDSSRFVFTENATTALNIAIKGILRPGDHAVTTSVEHNSVMRPLRRMEDGGVSVTVVQAGRDGSVDAKAVLSAVRRNTRLIAMVHASNVSGAIQPVGEIARKARRLGVYTLVDAAQTAGSLPIDLADLPADLVAAPGHKGLLGPQGTGFLYVRDRVPLVPLIEGGTGSRSENDRQPDFFPDALESGTQNSVGVAGLAVSLSWLLRRGVEDIRKKEAGLLAQAIEGLERIPRVTVFGPKDPARCVSVLSFLVEGMDPAETGRRLEKDFGILVRAGLHCSPNTHRTMGTFPEGTVRVSPGPFTTRREIARFLAAMRRISASRR